MVDVTEDHPLVPDEVGRLVIRPVGKRLLAVTHSVRFNVALVHQIESVLVAERKPDRIVRIVASADSIDIQFLHYADIPDHVSFGYHISLVWIHFMAVCPFDEDRFSQRLDVFGHIADKADDPVRFVIDDLDVRLLPLISEDDR